jgi:ATP-dependent helicase/nuclease subunit B
MDEIAKSHRAAWGWATLMQHLRRELAARQAHPARTVVLLPFAQMMPLAVQAWAEGEPASAFTPRFETTMNWAAGLGGLPPQDRDVSFDMARDMLSAAALLDESGGRLRAMAPLLAPRVVEAAHELAVQAAAVPPARRAAWGAALRERLLALPGGRADAEAFRIEALIAQIALAWTAHSSYTGDVLFEPRVSDGLDALVLVEGFQPDALGRALVAHLGGKGWMVGFPTRDLGPDAASAAALHAARHAEDEARRAAACVIHRLNGLAGLEGPDAGPVALVAQDRALTRRVRAMLAAQGLAIRDETGWKLSTTRAAAGLMALLRAARHDAAADQVVDWLKNAPAFAPSAVSALEARLRRMGVRDWPGLSDDPVAAAADALRAGLRAARPLSAWLRDLRGALRQSGQWERLLADIAGDTILSALRLHDEAEAEFADLGRRMDLPAFTAWVQAALEGASFRPPHPRDPQVVILPLSQLLGRPFAAVVLPGCDELRLPVSPEPGGPWTPAERAALGLPSREALATAQRLAWECALQAPQLDLLWRESEGGEHLMASGFVQVLDLAVMRRARSNAPAMQVPLPQAEAPACQPDANQPPRAADPRPLRRIAPSPTPAPRPQAAPLAGGRLSASAYADLRTCPYRYFALRLLRLQEADELEAEVDKRDFGTWLHAVLRRFHDGLAEDFVVGGAERVARIDTAAEAVTTELGLAGSDFLPFAAAWPKVRNGYLQWLEAHEAQGARYVAGEVPRTLPLGPVVLEGRIDRIDRLGDGRSLVIDYKTESRTTTAARVKEPLEDTQLAFYAALVDETGEAGLEAAYLNLGEREGTHAYRLEDLPAARDALVDGVLHDMQRIAQGAALPALGEGSACDFCAARGLCRKDFREPPA